MLAFPPTQIGYPQHRRVFRFLQISRRALRVTNSPTLEVIASPVANFIVLRKRKLKHQPSGAFLKATNGKISAFAAGLAQNGQIYTFQAWVAIFYIAPYERIISGWPSPERSHRPDLYISKQNPERSETTRSLHLSLEGNFYIAPYEYFISGWRRAD